MSQLGQWTDCVILDSKLLSNTEHWIILWKHNGLSLLLLLLILILLLLLLLLLQMLQPPPPLPPPHFIVLWITALYSCKLLSAFRKDTPLPSSRQLPRFLWILTVARTSNPFLHFSTQLFTCNTKTHGRGLDVLRPTCITHEFKIIGKTGPKRQE